MKLKHIALLALLLAILLPVTNILADVSPLNSPLLTPVPPTPKPEGLKNCPPSCIDNRTDIGYPTCDTWCVMQFKLDVKPKYITGCVLGWTQLGDLCIGPTPVPTLPTTTVITDEVEMDALWMGRCRMWWSSIQGRVTRVECP